MPAPLAKTVVKSAQRIPVTGIGVPGLDFVLGGGLPTNRVFLIEGNPGTGKTTLALQFLLEGFAQGEIALYITLAETRSELTAVAASHGWDLSGIEIFEVSPPDEVLNPETKYTVFHPSDVEMNQTVQGIYDIVERLRPARVVLDSLSEMRILAQDPLRLRRQVHALKHFFTRFGCRGTPGHGDRHGRRPPARQPDPLPAGSDHDPRSNRPRAGCM